MRSDEDGLESSPWYVKAFVRIGAPTAFASVLLWFLISNVTGTLNAILVTQQTHAETARNIIVNQNRILVMLDESHQQHDRLIATLQAICYNQASTDTGRERCYQGR